MNNTEKIELTKLKKEELIDKIQKLEHHIFDLKGQVRDLKKQIKKYKYIIENKETDELKIIPEERLSDILECIEKSNESEMICLNCESIIPIKLHPYAYDAENNEVVYSSRCPNCGEVLYSRD